jgi:hypothetical protein
MRKGVLLRVSPGLASWRWVQFSRRPCPRKPSSSSTRGSETGWRRRLSWARRAARREAPTCRTSTVPSSTSSRSPGAATSAVPIPSVIRAPDGTSWWRAGIGYGAFDNRFDTNQLAGKRKRDHHHLGGARDGVRFTFRESSASPHVRTHLLPHPGGVSLPDRRRPRGAGAVRRHAGQLGRRSHHARPRHRGALPPVHRAGDHRAHLPPQVLRHPTDPALDGRAQLRESLPDVEERAGRRPPPAPLRRSPGRAGPA